MDPIGPKAEVSLPKKRRRLVIEASICHVIRRDELLLKKANDGLSLGKWSAPGGKLESGESPEECAKREVFEETGLRVSELLYHGTLTFVMDGGRNLHTKAHLFSTRKAKGRARASAEGPVRWFPLENLPIVNMWEDDRFWLPLMLKGARFDATFSYDERNQHVTAFVITSR